MVHRVGRRVALSAARYHAASHIGLRLVVDRGIELGAASADDGGGQGVCRHIHIVAVGRNSLHGACLPAAGNGRSGISRKRTLGLGRPWADGHQTAARAVGTAGEVPEAAAADADSPERAAFRGALSRDIRSQIARQVGDIRATGEIAANGHAFCRGIERRCIVAFNGQIIGIIGALAEIHADFRILLRRGHIGLDRAANGRRIADGLGLGILVGAARIALLSVKGRECHSVTSEGRTLRRCQLYLAAHLGRGNRGTASAHERTTVSRGICHYLRGALGRKGQFLAAQHIGPRQGDGAAALVLGRGHHALERHGSGSTAKGLCRNDVGLAAFHRYSAFACKSSAIQRDAGIAVILRLGDQSTAADETGRRHAGDAGARGPGILGLDGDIAAFRISSCKRAVLQRDGRRAAGAALGIGRTEFRRAREASLIGIDGRLSMLSSLSRKVRPCRQVAAFHRDAGFLVRIEDGHRGAHADRTRKAGRSCRHLGIGLAVCRQGEFFTCIDRGIRHGDLGPLAGAGAIAGLNTGVILHIDPGGLVVQRSLDRIRRAAGAALLSIHGFIGILQYTGGIERSSVIRWATVAVCNRRADGGHHHIGVEAHSAHGGTRHGLIDIQFFPGVHGCCLGYNLAARHLGRRSCIDSVDADAGRDGRTACRSLDGIELRLHFIVGIHRQGVIGLDITAAHQCGRCAIQIVDSHGNTGADYRTGHTEDMRIHFTCAVCGHADSARIGQAVLPARRNGAAREFCRGIEIVIDHADAGPDGTAGNGRADGRRSADKSGLMIVVGSHRESHILARDILDERLRAAAEFCGRCCSCCRAGAIGAARDSQAVCIGDHIRSLTRLYIDGTAVDRGFRFIAAAELCLRRAVKDERIRSCTDAGTAGGSADANGQRAHMALALSFIFGIDGNVISSSSGMIGIDRGIGERGFGRSADLVHRDGARCAHAHIAGNRSTGGQSHALEVMLPVGSHYDALAGIRADLDAIAVHAAGQGHRIRFLPFGRQRAAENLAGSRAGDSIVADAHADAGLAAGCHRQSPGVIAQVFTAIGHDDNIARIGQTAVLHSCRYMVANLVDGDVAGNGKFSCCSSSYAHGCDGRISRRLNRDVLALQCTVANSCRRILVDAVDGHTSTNGSVPAARPRKGRTGDLAFARRLYIHNGRLIFILIDEAVPDFSRNGLVDESRRCGALHGYLAGTADADTHRRQDRGIRGVHCHRAILDVLQDCGDKSCTGLLPGVFCTGRCAAHIVIGHGAADGNFTARADASGHSQTVVAARSLYLGALGVGQDRVFGLMTALIIQGLADDCFRIAAAVVDRNGAAESRVFAGCHSCADAVDLAGILGGHFDGRTVRTFGRDTAAGQVGTDVVVQTIVGQGSPNACRLAVGHGTGYVHGLGVARRIHLEVVRGQGGIRHLGLDPVVLILPGHATHAAEVLRASSHAGRHIDRQRIRIGLGRNGIGRKHSIVDGRREIVVQFGHVDCRAGRIAAGAGHHKGGTHAEAAPVAVIVHGFSCRHRVPIVLIVFVIGILVVGTAVRINASVFGKLLMIPVVPQEVLIRLGFCRAAGGIVCADRDGIRRHPGAAIDAGLHIIVQAVVDHGSGKGVVCPITTHGDAGRDGRRNLPGGQ